MDLETRKAYLIQIGNVCNQHSFFEYVIAHAIWHLLKLDKETGTIVTRGMDLRPLLEMAIELAAHLKTDKEVQAALGNALKEIEKLNPKRNDIVHGVYSQSDSSKILKRENHRRKNRDRKEITVDEIAEVGKNYSEASQKVLMAFEKHNILID